MYVCCACMHDWFVWAITCTFMHGFQNNLAQLFSLKGRIAILNFCRGRLKVKVTLGGRSGGGVVDNMLDYESRDHKIDPQLLRSFGWDFKLRSHLCMTSLLVGRYTRVHSPDLKASAYKLSVVHDLLPLIYVIAIQLTITK